MKSIRIVAKTTRSAPRLSSPAGGSRRAGRRTAQARDRTARAPRRGRRRLRAPGRPACTGDYNGAVSGAPPGFVDVIRDFLIAHRELRGLFALFRASRLRFEDLDRVFVDDERSVLFRLKERCHALFRPRSGRARAGRHREVLFDLAVGSLFHEVMKFRENFYQREVYGPQVRALRAEVDPAGAALFLEFEKILDAVSARLGEGLEEIEALLAQTRSQLLLLLAEHAEDGLVMRSAIEHRGEVEEVFGRPLEALFAELHAGRAARGF